jgi:FkbM family methyltransferase
VQSWFDRVFKPEYVFQPRVVLNRVRAAAGLAARSIADGRPRAFALPWGPTIFVPVGDDHARMLETLGVVDLAVTEALWRLADPADHVVDAGANIGYMTAVLLARVDAASGGRVTAVEAHPGVRRDLDRNLEEWRAERAAPVKVVAAALSSAEGFVSLVEPDQFDSNRGLARVGEALAAGSGLQVPAVTLDAIVPSPEAIGVLKLDVEGHELEVLRGATRLLADGRIRDCVFEDHGTAPTAVMKALLGHGYQIFRIDRRLAGPVLLPMTSPDATRWLPANFLATLSPERVAERFRARGWQCLSAGAARS